MLTRPSTLKRLLRAREVLHDGFAEPLTIGDLANAAGLSRFYFLRSFARVFGTTPHAYLVSLRLEHARRLLARGDSVTETCMAVGYDSVGSFSTLFTRHVGRSPRAWKRHARSVMTVPELGPALWVRSCFPMLYAEGNSREAPPPPS